MSVILGVLLIALTGAGVAGWFWRRTRNPGRHRVLRDTTHLGPFVNLHLLSDKGGMAKIHRATNSETKRDCVLKVLRSEMLGSPEVVKKFRREADILQSIKQSAPDAPVVSVYSTGTISTSFVELPYIEMEYIPGGIDLSDYIRNHQHVDPQIAATIVTQVVQALRGADGIAVHRDLKPGNIMLANGDPRRVIVCDFGVAKEMDSRSVSRNAYGTAAYMAPEQCVPDGRVSRATDVYALGVIWYRMLTGSLLFDDPNPLVVMHSHVERDPRPEIEANVPEPYRQILVRMLAKNPAERPGFDEMEQVLHDPVRRFACPLKAVDDSVDQTAILIPKGQVSHPGGGRVAAQKPRNIRRAIPYATVGGTVCILSAVWLTGGFSQDVQWEVRSEPPGAEVRVDGHIAGPTPLTVALTPGDHHVRMELEGYNPVDSSIKVRRGENGTLVKSLIPAVAPPPAGEKWEVSSAPSGAEVQVDDRSAGHTPLTVLLTPGEHSVRLALEGFKSFNSTAKVQPGQAGALHAALTPLPASLTLTSSPPGAAVVVDGESRGATPVTMEIERPGKLKVTASLAGFAPQERLILVSAGKPATAVFNFVKERGWLTVHSVRAAADVWLDDTRLVCVTPCERVPLPVGSYVLTMRARGFREFRTTIEIQHDSERLVDVSLEEATPARGLLTVNVQPDGAVVQVDGVRVGQTPLVEWNLAPGDHTLSVTAPGLRPLEKHLEIAPGKTEMVSGALALAASVVEIISEPPGFDVHFDGVPRGKTPLTLADQSPGRHSIALVDGGRLRWQGEVTLDGSREREVVRAVVAADPPRPLVNGSISVNVTVQGKPGWGTVMVNGKSVGNSPVLLKDLEPQEYRIRVQRPGFQRKEEVVTLFSGERKLVTVDIVPE